MADNHILILYTQHVSRHGSRYFTYFDLEKKKFVSDQIMKFSKNKLNENKVKRKRVKANEKAMLEEKYIFPD